MSVEHREIHDFMFVVKTRESACSRSWPKLIHDCHLSRSLHPTITIALSARQSAARGHPNRRNRRKRRNRHQRRDRRDRRVPDGGLTGAQAFPLPLPHPRSFVFLVADVRCGRLLL